MLRTASREIHPGIVAIVREPTNADFYATRQLYKRLIEIYPDSDFMMKELFGRFILIHTRTESVDGYIFMAVSSNNSDDTLRAALDVFMSLPKAMTEGWALIAAELDDPVPTVINSENTKVPDPKN